MPSLTTSVLIERLKALLNVKSDGEVAEFLGLTRSALAMKKNRNSPIVNEVLALAQQIDIDLNQLLLRNARPQVTEFVSLVDDHGNLAREIKLSKEYLDSRGLDPEYLVVVKQESLPSHNLHFVDTRVTRITNPGIYAIETDNNVQLRQATVRLDGSILFPSHTPEIPSETVEKNNIDRLQIIGKTVLMLAPPE